MVATVGVSFHTGVTLFMELLWVVLHVNQAVFLLIAEVLAVTAFVVIVHLFIVGCIGGVSFGGIW